LGVALPGRGWGASARSDRHGRGGAPLYLYSGDPDTHDYIKQNESQKITLDRIAKPAYEPGMGAYHYVLVTVDGDRFSLEVIGVDWGRDFSALP